GKTALILGAGSVGEGWGNGRATAVLFAREGARVFGVDRDPEALARTAELAAAEGLEILTRTADVTNTQEMDALVAAAHGALGRIDILVNNVGGSAPGDVVSMADEVWSRQFEHNIDYVFQSMKRVVPIMVAQGGGAIVNLASIAGLRFFGADCVAYAAAKAGVIKMSQVTAVKYAAQGVRVNTVVPGLMNTPLVAGRLVAERNASDAAALIAARHRQVPMGRMGDAWDVAYAALFLASDEARHVTGTELIVDGGLSATCVAPHPDA
ncbi:MAG: SDR family oxidoreductase, partial [Proteobacteria bacterium]|nr:SDR family oxidoreductase [Pseudomonadota bacterium]